MNHKNITEQIRELGFAPEPERKKEFFRRVGDMGLLTRRPVVISHKEFLAIQFFYIEKRIWIMSGFLLLFIAWICCRHTGNYPFALTPLLAAGILFETGRSRRWNMTELEQAARFSARAVMLARIFLLSAVNTAGLLVVILTVRPFFSYTMVQVFLYMMVPYLTASLLGSVYERSHRADQGWGSVLICILSSVFFATASSFFNTLYEENLIVLWAAVFIFLSCGLTICIRKSITEREEPLWS